MVSELANFRLLMILFCSFFSLTGCSFAVHQKEFRAYTAGSPDWKMIEECGYEHCSPMVDFLTAKNLTIRLEFDNDWQTKRSFVIRTWFMSVNSQFEYNPSVITVKLKNNGEVLKPKAFACSQSVKDSSQALQAPVPVKKYACYKLFFDHEQLSYDDEAEMNMDKSIISSGVPVDIPLIRFKKNINLK